MAGIRGKSFKATLYDISEGYLTVNPILLKTMDPETLKELYAETHKAQAGIRSESFPHGDMEAIKMRNMRLQRLHIAAMVIKNFARERRIKIV